MNCTLKSDALTVTVSDHGAEILSVCGVKKRTEFWYPGHLDNLHTLMFPTITISKDGYILSGGSRYEMPPAGFLKMMQLETSSHNDSSVTLHLKDNEVTRRYWPYGFSLSIRYAVERDILQAVFTIRNTGDHTLPYMLGFHPMYNTPTDEEPYVLRFDPPLNADRYIRENLLVTGIHRHFLEDVREIPVNETTFAEGTLGLTGLSSRKMEIHAVKSGRSILIDSSDFRSMGIYAPPHNIRYVSAECWEGSPDRAEDDHVWEHKEDMNLLPSGEEKVFRYSARFME